MGTKVMESVTGRDFSVILKLSNLTKKNAYDKKTNLDDIYFSANGDENVHPLSKFKNAQPNAQGVLNVSFYNSNEKSPKTEIFSCTWTGLFNSISEGHIKFVQAQDKLQALFDAADAVVQEYFG